jgi:flagella basal body P-ring formation protein FlgA
MLLRLMPVLVLAAAVASGAAAEPVIASLPVPRATIYPGDAIAAEILATREFRQLAGGARAYHTSADDLAGKLARRTLLAGQPVPIDAVRKPELVTQGRTYPMLYRSGGLTIAGTGVPLQSASAGDMINVRNPETGIIVKGRVQADGTIAVDDP